jgi:hypothetical protein
MFEPQVLQGRLLTQTHLDEIRTLIELHPTASRKHLSRLLAQAWDWRSAAGQLKDMAARTLMLKLHERQLLVLPARRRLSPKRRALDTPELFDLPTDSLAVEGPLSACLPLTLTPLARRDPQMYVFSRLLARHHYLGYRGPVGENIAYRVQDPSGRDLACVLFGAAAWKVAPRDQWIGWLPLSRAQRLAWIANNNRYLILPGVKVPHLASHILSRIARRIASDWQAKYGHPLYLLETFVERDRFKGTCYKAANWICVGQTQGRSRQDRYTTLHVPIKDVYVYPLLPDARERLCQTIPS